MPETVATLLTEEIRELAAEVLVCADVVICYNGPRTHVYWEQRAEDGMLLSLDTHLAKPLTDDMSGSDVKRAIFALEDSSGGDCLEVRSSLSQEEQLVLDNDPYLQFVFEQLTNHVRLSNHLPIRVADKRISYAVSPIEKMSRDSDAYRFNGRYLPTLAPHIEIVRKGPEKK